MTPDERARIVAEGFRNAVDGLDPNFALALRREVGASSQHEVAARSGRTHRSRTRPLTIVHGLVENGISVQGRSPVRRPVVGRFADR